MTNYFQMDGLAYRFVPIHASQTGGVDADKLYDRMMNHFRWGNISDPNVYLCETNTRLLTTFRSNFGQLADVLIAENKKDSAVMALDSAFRKIPTYQLSYNYHDLNLLIQYYRAGAKEKGSALSEDMFKAFSEELAYFQSFPSKFSSSVVRELNNRKYVLLFNVCDITRQYDRELFETYRNYWQTLFSDEPYEQVRAMLLRQRILLSADNFDIGDWDWDEE
jgi:hypothetical protein